MWTFLFACPEPGPSAPPLPTVRITAPADGAAVAAAAAVEVQVTGFAFVAPTGTASLPPWPWLAARGAAAHEAGEAPEGYVSWSIDLVEVAKVASTAATLDTSGLAEGPHVLRAELFYPDGDGFYPSVADEIEIRRDAR